MKRRYFLIVVLVALMVVSAFSVAINFGQLGKGRTETNGKPSSGTNVANALNHTAIYQVSIDTLRSQIGLAENRALREVTTRLSNVSYLIYQQSGNIVSESDRGSVGFEGKNATAVIQHTIDSLGSSGGTVVLEPGEYVLSSPIVISQTMNATLTGEGWGTVLTEDSGFPSYLIKVTASNWTLENFLLNCSSQANNGSPGIAVHGSNVTVRDTYVTGSPHGGIVIWGPRDVVEYNDLVRNRNDGVIALGESEIVRYNFVEYTGEYNGISAVGATDEVVSHNLVIHPASSGLAAEPSGIGSANLGTPCGNITMVDNIIFNPGYAGVNIYDFGALNLTVLGNTIILPHVTGVVIADRNSQILVSNNTVDTVTGEGVLLAPKTMPARHIDLVGNRIYNLKNPTTLGILLIGDTYGVSIKGNFINGTTGIGISLSGNNSRTTISSNTFSGLKFGVVELAPSDYNTITGNRFTGVQDTPIIKQGAHDLMQNNTTP